MTAPTLREPVTPGDVLKEEFLDPMKITAYQLCKETGLGQTQVSEIIKGKRAITIETDAALSKYFGLSRGYWRRMQVSYEQRKKARQLRMIEEKVTPYAELHPLNNQPELVNC
jgi:hypothetical protein